MKTFISGGAKNGKSMFAQKLAKNSSVTENGCKRPLYYIATMEPADNEDEERIIRHKREREGWGFETVESAKNIDIIIDICDVNGSFLLDSLTALLANEMFPKNGAIVNDAFLKVAKDIDKLLKHIKNIVIVSDYIFSDARMYVELTENYRRGLAYLDKQVAAACDVVLEAYYGNIIVYKGKELGGISV